MSGTNGIIFIEGVPQAVKKVENRGMCLRAADGAHWNELGHKIAADVLIQYFKELWINKKVDNDSKKELIQE